MGVLLKIYQYRLKYYMFRWIVDRQIQMTMARRDQDHKCARQRIPFDVGPARCSLVGEPDVPHQAEEEHDSQMTSLTGAWVD
jgi:hypothetical protein